MSEQLRAALDALADEFPVTDVSPAPWVVEKGSIAWMIREGPGGPQIGNFILEADARFVAEQRNALAAAPSTPEPCPNCRESASGVCTEHNGSTALAAAPSTPEPGIDVERLMVAVFNADRPGDWPTWDDYLAAFGSAGTPPWRRKAAKIIAEYARLASTPLKGE